MFARQTYFDKQLNTTSVELLHYTLSSKITDHQTQLKLFLLCTINKLPHLLNANVMHNHMTEFDNKQWYNWNGHLTECIDSATHGFLPQLLNLPTTEDLLPIYSTLISHLNINCGGLGILNASNKAVINLMTCLRQINQTTCLYHTPCQ